MKIISLRSNFLNAYSCQAGCKRVSAHWQADKHLPLVPATPQPTELAGERNEKERDDKNIHTGYV